MLVITSLYQFITWGVTAVIVAAILLIVMRSIFNYMDVNPFKWSPRTVRRVTDPVIMPVRRVLIGPERTLGAPGPVILRQLASGRITGKCVQIGGRFRYEHVNLH